MLKPEPSNIFAPRNDWGVIALRCKQRVNNYQKYAEAVGRIIEEVTGFNPFDATKYRKRGLTEARQLLMVMLVNRNNRSYREIGLLLGKDHATVSHAKKVVANLCETDKDFLMNYCLIERKVKAL